MRESCEFKDFASLRNSSLTTSNTCWRKMVSSSGTVQANDEDSDFYRHQQTSHYTIITPPPPHNIITPSHNIITPSILHHYITSRHHSTSHFMTPLHNIVSLYQIIDLHIISCQANQVNSFTAPQRNS